MRVGFSLSPGGLLLPYHLGVLDGLQYQSFLDNQTPLAGASAGAIACASKACSIDSTLILDETIDISNTCSQLGRARGNLLPLLREKLERHIDEERFQAFQARKGETVVSYHEIFPSFGSVHQTEFQQKEEIIDAVCHSSTFPFFASNWPVGVDYGAGSKAVRLGGTSMSFKIPRVVVDGFFAVKRERFGCPDFELAGVDVDRTVLVTSFPRDAISLMKSVPSENCICPELVDDGIMQSANLLRLATQPSEAAELTDVYEAGFADAEKWCRNEVIRARKEATEKREAARRLDCLDS